MWEEVVRRLDAPARPVATPAGSSFNSTAARLAEIGGRAAYVGYSQGGRLALGVALDSPKSVTKLVLISAAPGLSPQEAQERARQDEEWAAMAESLGAEVFFDEWLGQAIFAERDQSVARRYRLTESSEIADQMRKLGQGVMPNLRTRLGEIAVPTLIVAGELDAKYVELGFEMAAAIGANASVAVVPGAGHAVVESHPDDVADLLREFL